MSASCDPGASALGGGIFGLPHTPDDARVGLAACWAEGQIPKPHLPHPDAHLGQRTIKIANR